MTAKAKAESPAALEKYRQKRHFDVTAEPSGSEEIPGNERLSFCIQKHDATRLHYDFRLELDGVLKSWAVTRGPSFSPHDKRLAVEVEDHPLAYGGFEGTIPEGEYGGGTVMLWDRGWWEPLEDAHEGLKKGAIKFALHGEKLTGRWTLIRMPPRPKDRHANWLLIKEKDEVAKPDGPALPGNDDESVLSGRSLEQIAAEPGRVWHSKTADGEAPATGKTAKTKKTEPPISKGKSKPLAFVAPELATLSDTVPTGNWLHEIKFDGYRLLASVVDGSVTLYTRTGLDWTSRFREVAESLEKLPGTALLDGEAVVLKPDGVSDFSALQARLAGESDHEITFFAFDLLHRDGKDMRPLKLTDRKAELQDMLGTLKTRRIVYSDHMTGSGALFLKHGCESGIEGIVSKKADAPYRSGRMGDWLKIKCGHRQEFVVGGYVPPGDGNKWGIGSLAVGYFRDGALHYAGRVGTGYTDAISRDLRKRLDAIKADKHPFAGKLPRDVTRGVTWVEPRLVAEVSFAGFTGEGLIRHAAYKGLREDKPAGEVKLEEAPAAASEPKHSHAKSPARAEMEIAGVRLTHPDKVLDEDSGMTKQQLAEYYVSIADWILPGIVDRPLSIVRCPEGVGHPCFFQRHVAASLPDDLHVVHPGGKGAESYFSIGDIQGLVSLVQVGALEIHPWGAPGSHVDHADRVIFDLDPDPAVGWEEVVRAAVLCRDRLAKLKLKSFVRTTGGKGLHVVAPLDGTRDWDVVKTFAHRFADAMVDAEPDRFIAVMSKAGRKGKIFVDYLRNDRTATAIASYSTRARVGAPVATPLTWDELSARTDPHSFDIHTVAARLKALKADPWKGFVKSSATCPEKP